MLFYINTCVDCSLHGRKSLPYTRTDEVYVIPVLVYERIGCQATFPASVEILNTNTSIPACKHNNIIFQLADNLVIHFCSQG